MYTYVFIVISSLICLVSETFQIKVVVKMKVRFMSNIFFPLGSCGICNYKTHDRAERAIDYLT